MTFRTTTIVSIVLLITVVAALISYISLRNGRQAVEDVTHQLQAQILDNVQEKLGDYLAMPHMLNRLNAATLHRRPELMTKLVDLRAEYIQQLYAFDPVMTVALGVQQQGNYVGVGRYASNAFESGLRDHAVDSTYRVSLLDSQGIAVQVLSETPDYDARTRAWYRAGVQAGQATWSPIYVWASRQNIGLTAVLPIYDDNDNLLGVQQSALSLEYIGNFLQSLRVGKAGQIFLMEPSGLLVASSVGEKPVRSGGNGDDLVRFQAVESSEPFIMAAAASLAGQIDHLHDLPVPYQTRLDVSGQTYLLQAANLTDPYGLNWILVVGLPEAEVLARVNANRQINLLLGGLAIVAALVLGAFTAHRVTQPILVLNMAAKELAQGRWDQQVTLSRCDEIGELADSFNRMAAQLRDLFTSLEERVMQRTADLSAANEHLAQEILERREIQATLEMRNETMAAIYSIMVDFLHRRKVGELLQAIVLHSTTLLDVPYSAILLLDGEELAVHAFTPNQASLANLRVGRAEALLAWRAIDTCQPAVLDDYTQSPGWRTIIDSQKLHAVADFPILKGDRCLGVLVIGRDRPGYIFDPEQIQTGSLFAQLAALALDNAQLYEMALVELEERRRAESVLRQYAIELDTRNKELDTFAHTVAHDLKNPAGVIIGFADVLADSYTILPADQLEEALRKIAHTGRKLNTIIDELMLLAGLHKQEVVPQPLAMSSIVNEALQRLANLIEEHSTQISRPDEAAWPVALGYAPWIEEVWANYLSNAIKYGGRPPRLELGATVQADSTVRFWVRDNGSGLSPEDQARLFTPFTRLDQVQVRGHGLGLSIVRRIVEKLGGAVGVESQVGQGSTFFFTLPAPAVGEPTSIPNLFGRKVRPDEIV